MSEVVAGNVYDKYSTRNPIARRLIQGFDRGMFSLLRKVGRVESVLEVGCGEGEVLEKLSRVFPDASLLGTDLSPEIIAVAKERHPRLDFRVGSIYEVGEHERRYDLVVAAEVLEHLEHPREALSALCRMTRGFVFASVPREPMWRVFNCARGRYWGSLGNTPGHLQHWSSSGFLRFLSSEAEILGIERPIPWTQALFKPKSA